MALRKPLVLVALFCASILSLSLGTSCTGTGTVVKAAGVQVVTVDTAMQSWSDWVNAGNATQGQVDAVHSAYDKYYAAAKAEQAALTAYVIAKGTTNGVSVAQAELSAVQAALSAAKGDLISLIQKLKN